MSEKTELDLLHSIGKTGATSDLVALMRMRLENKLAALREEEAKDWLKRSASKGDELRAQIRLLGSMLFDFELFGEHPDRTWTDYRNHTMTVVTPEEHTRLQREQREALEKKLKTSESEK